MAVGFASVGDTNMYLNNSIIMYDGVPHYVSNTGAEKNNEVTGFCMSPMLMKHDQGKKLSVTDNKFVHNGILLGYVNYKGQATYVKRKPSRRQKSGVCKNSLCKSKYNINLTDKSFANMLMNKYPSFDTCIYKLEDRRTISAAFHRDLAIGYGSERDILHLYHKGKDIGYRVQGNDHFILYESRQASFLMNMLNDYNIEGLEV